MHGNLPQHPSTHRTVTAATNTLNTVCHFVPTNTELHRLYRVVEVNLLRTHPHVRVHRTPSSTTSALVLEQVE